MGEIKSWCIAVGDPMVGFVMVGPFASADEADDYAESEYRNETWWTYGLVTPVSDLGN